MDKLLVVDDESDVVSLLKLVLEAEGYQVVPAFTGEEALRLAEFEPPDLVLLDLMMPGIGGLETCRHMKSNLRTREVPVIVFSALGREVDKKLTSEAGASAHITKPFNNVGLTTEVKRCLNETRGWKFSKQLGIEHSKLTGRKILFEFEPRTNYERIVRDFALECSFLGESVIVTTKKSSGVRQVLEGDQGVKFIDLEHASELLPTLHEYSQGPLTIVFDNLTDMTFNGTQGGSGMCTFVQRALETLNDPRITALFLLNPSAHDPMEIARVRGIFSNQLVCSKTGVSVATLA